MTSEVRPSTMLYMDFNATTPLAAEVVADITESLSQHWANPSSTHAPGLSARCVVEEARGHVASAIGAQPEHVIFTSGGTEANNMVIRGALDFYSATGRGGTPHLITSDVEHDAVEGPIAELERRRLCSVTRLRCHSGGRVLACDLRAALTSDTCLVSVMHANNETGVLNDIAALARVLEESPYRNQIWFHTDSAQTVGKVEVDVTRLGVDFLTVVGHKLYGPRIGALWSSPLGLSRLPADGGGAACVSLLRGGGQESGVRPGTENTPLVRGLGTACRLVRERLTADRRHMQRLRDLMETRLLETGVAERINLQTTDRLPNTVSAVLSCRSSGREVLRRCRRLLASVGSACHEPAAEPAGRGGSGAGRTAADCPPGTQRGEGGLSRVLLRSGVPPEDARRTVRLSLGRSTTEQDVLEAVEDLRQAALEAAGQEQGTDQ